MGIAVSVLITSDYQSGADRSWKDEARCFRALAKQDIPEPVEYILCEGIGAPPPPAEVLALLPGLRVERFPTAGSYSWKNAGTRLAKGEFVAILDTDCEPCPGWLRFAVESLRARPEMAGVSGRTRYPGESFDERALAILSRGFLDPGQSGETPFLANQCGIIRRDLFLRYPLPEGLGAFTAHMQSDRMRRDGYRFWFDDRISLIHGFEGWDMERDIRVNCGWGTIRTRLEDPAMPYSWLVRLGPMAIPAIVLGKLWDTWATAVRCLRHYRLGWMDLPRVFVMAIRVQAWEIPGMRMAYAGKDVTATAYR